MDYYWRDILLGGNGGRGGVKKEEEGLAFSKVRLLVQISRQQ